MMGIVSYKCPTAPRSQHNRNPAGEGNFYNFNRRKTAQESRSSKNIQEDESSFKKHFQGMNEKDKRKSRSPLSRLTLWGVEEFLVTTIVRPQKL